MSRTEVRVTLDQKAIRGLTADVTNACASRAANRVARRVSSNITRSGRVRTGRMRDSITTRRRTSTANRALIDIYSTVHYAGFQEFGIGPVRPVRAKVLRFKPKGSNVFIFRPRTKGFKGAYFFRRTYNSITLADFLP